MPGCNINTRTRWRLTPPPSTPTTYAREVETRLNARWTADWLVGFRGITKAYNERTIIPCIIPRHGVGHTAPLVQIGEPAVTAAFAFTAMLSSSVTDWTLRLRKGGTHLTYTYLDQVPVVHRRVFAQP